MARAAKMIRGERAKTLSDARARRRRRGAGGGGGGGGGSGGGGGGSRGGRSGGGSGGTAHGIYHFLDMGREKYGDCILAVFGNAHILIDGGHRSDFKGQTDFTSIPQQLEQLIGPPPFKVDLLVVTHCHSDHIGCLPDMVAAGMLEPKSALVAHEGLGFGRSADGGDAVAFDALPEPIKRVVAALREEDRSDLRGAELDAFLADAATLEDRYKTMLATLESKGTKLIRYVGGDEAQPIMDAFRDTGLTVLGPTQQHLLKCAHAIAAATTDAIGTVSDAVRRTDESEGDLYRRIVGAARSSDVEGGLDRPGKGAALNDQSIVLTFEGGDTKVLLAGDMQFALPEISGLDDDMTQLRGKVKEHGPYSFAKLSHHSSYNGLDDGVYEDFGRPRFMVHTGGQKDAGHPDPGSLKLLENLDDIGFARTDRNGLITVDLMKGPDAATVMTLSRGSLNDFAPNRVSDAELPAAEPAPKLPLGRAGHRGVLAGGSGDAVELLFVRIPYEDGRVVLNGFAVEIAGRGGTTREAARAGVEGSQEVRDKARPQGSAGPAAVPRPIPGKLAAGRQLPNLLFVTQKARLAANIGAAEADQAIKMITDARQQLFDIGSSADAIGAVRKHLAMLERVAGVVIVGGYDVVPSQRVDVLDSNLRQRIGARVNSEPDRFLVWSDEGYGDTDADSMPELPVTRIPDARSAQFLLTALTAVAHGSSGRFGIRNSARPFANVIWSGVAGAQALLVSGPAATGTVVVGNVRQPFVYFMLHGSDGDATRFWGEQGGMVEAINVSKVPANGVGLALAGCCWGALSVNHKASDPATVIAPRTPEQSMALSIIKAGAQAFVGCTGAHYSPGPDASFFGGPMHRAFWTEIVTHGKPPAQALFDAKREYLRGMPHGRTDPFDIGVERKIYKQFTCLGLAW